MQFSNDYEGAWLTFPLLWIKQFCCIDEHAVHDGQNCSVKYELNLCFRKLHRKKIYSKH